MPHKIPDDLPPLDPDKQLEAVKISDLKVSAEPQAVLVTYALGSCVAVTMYDPSKRIGGMLHFLLPAFRGDGIEPIKSPMTFADTGVELLLDKMLGLGADKERLEVKAAGGAQLLGSTGALDVGRDNYEGLIKALSKHGLSLRSEEIGGTEARTATLEIDTGKVTIKSKDKIIQI